MPLPKFIPCWLVHLLRGRSCLAEPVGRKRAQHLGFFLHRQGTQVPACYKEQNITPPLMRHFKKQESHLNLVMIRDPLIGAFGGLGARTTNMTTSYVQMLITTEVRYTPACICGMTFETDKIRKIYLQSTEYVHGCLKKNKFLQARTKRYTEN